jgi:hypothetical protein
VKGTKLWQAPGSPIIQGRSRTARPFWEVWLAGAVWAQIAVIAAATAWMLRSPEVTFGNAISETLRIVLLPSMPGCMLGSALGVLVGRTMGWRRAWLAGAVLGAIAGWVLAWIL